FPTRRSSDLSFAQVYFQKRTRLFRVPEIGKRESWFPVRREKGKAKEKNCCSQSGRSLRTPRASGTRFGSRPYLKLRRRNTVRRASGLSSVTRGGLAVVCARTGARSPFVGSGIADLLLSYVVATRCGVIL